MANDRDCENCIHKVNGACNVWECKFEPKSEIYRPCSKCHNEECVFMGRSDTHSLCEDFKPKFGTWIPVSESLPEEKQSVLVWCPEYKNMYCAYLENKNWWIFGAFSRIIPNAVIAWMPLPEPYKAEGSKE